jgi:cell division transport system ATP-binding protein
VSDNRPLSLKNAAIYQGKNLVLSGVNLELRAGDFAYLIGETGSGKSSLLRTLYADLPLQGGEGSVVGYNLSTVKEAEIPFLRRKIGIVFQDFQLLYERSVYDNLDFVLQATGHNQADENKAKIEKVLQQVGVSTKGHKFPHQLSGGEQQRVAIARALLNAPELLLADEPTGNLDPATSEEIMLLLKEIGQSGTAVLMATHDYALLLKFPHPTYKCSGGTVNAAVQRTL